LQINAQFTGRLLQCCAFCPTHVGVSSEKTSVRGKFSEEGG
jgi:hypothetical protein